MQSQQFHKHTALDRFRKSKRSSSEYKLSSAAQTSRHPDVRSPCDEKVESTRWKKFPPIELILNETARAQLSPLNFLMSSNLKCHSLSLCKIHNGISWNYLLKQTNMAERLSSKTRQPHLEIQTSLFSKTCVGLGADGCLHLWIDTEITFTVSAIWWKRQWVFTVTFSENLSAEKAFFVAKSIKKLLIKQNVSLSWHDCFRNTPQVCTFDRCIIGCLQ